MYDSNVNNVNYDGSNSYIDCSSVPNFDINLLRMAAQEVCNNPNFNMNNSNNNNNNDLFTNGYGKVEYNNYNGNGNYADYSQYSPNQMMDSPGGYSMKHRDNRMNGTDRSLTIPLLDLTDRNGYHHMGNNVMPQQMQKPSNYRNGTLPEQYNWNNGRYPDSLPLNIDIDQIKDLYKNENNQRPILPPNYNNNKHDARMYNNPPPPFTYDLNYNDVKVMDGNKEFNRNPAPEQQMTQEDALRKILNQRNANAPMNTPPYRAISKANHFKSNNAYNYDVGNYQHNQFVAAPPMTEQRNYNNAPVKKNAVQAYLEEQKFKEAETFALALQREQMIRNIEQANSSYVTQKQLYQRNVEMQKEIQENMRLTYKNQQNFQQAVEEGRISGVMVPALGLPPAPLTTGSGNGKVLAAWLDWLPLMNLRNFR